MRRFVIAAIAVLWVGVAFAGFNGGFGDNIGFSSPPASASSHSFFLIQTGSILLIQTGSKLEIQ